MSESDSFISEVSEELRRDRFYRFLGRWGWLIAAVILVIVGGTGAMEWRKHIRQNEAEVAGDALRGALAEADPAKRAEGLGALAESDPDAALVAHLAEAGSLAEAGETARAAEVLAGIADAPGTPGLYRALANLQRVMLLGPDMPRSERLATLEGLLAPEAPFRPLALEQRALVHLEDGDKAAAIADLEAALEAPGATDALQARARQLIVAAGGALPVEGTAAGADVPADAVPADSAPADG